MEWQRAAAVQDAGAREVSVGLRESVVAFAQPPNFQLPNPRNMAT